MISRIRAFGAFLRSVLQKCNTVIMESQSRRPRSVSISERCHRVRLSAQQGVIHIHQDSHFEVQIKRICNIATNNGHAVIKARPLDLVTVITPRFRRSKSRLLQGNTDRAPIVSFTLPEQTCGYRNVTCHVKSSPNILQLTIHGLENKMTSTSHVPCGLDRKVPSVTGSGRGIGAAITELGRLGAKVVMNYANSA